MVAGYGDLMMSPAQHMRTLLAPLATALAVGFASVMADDLPSWNAPSQAIILAATQGQMNFCLGGFEHRKQIVGDSSLDNPFRQTTLLACQLDGGTPVVLPDLPRPGPHKTALV